MSSVKGIKRYRGDILSGSIVQADAVDFMRTIKTGSASLVFLDPPFNLGKIYSAQNLSLDLRSPADYRLWMEKVLEESNRILEDGGTLYLYHLPKWAVRFAAFLESYLSFRHWIAVSMKSSFVRGNWLYPAHYALLMFTKGDPVHFKRPRIEAKRCRHCQKYIKDYGGYRKIIQQKGVNLSDFWDDLSPVRHANHKFRSANELPEVLFKRIIEISGAPNLLYVDPFVGSGAGVVQAASAHMRFMACDIVKENCEIVCARLNGLRKQL